MAAIKHPIQVLVYMVYTIMSYGVRHHLYGVHHWCTLSCYMVYTIIYVVYATMLYGVHRHLYGVHRVT